MKEAEKWQIKNSDILGLTRNKIRKINDKTIEVKLTKGMTMITDIQFVNICQKYTIVSHKGGKNDAEYYATFSINNKLQFYHNYITGNSMTDHINRNPLDNRLCNLRKSNHKLNNNNRSINKKGTKTGILGVKSNKNSFSGYIKQNKKIYSKSFSIKKYGYEKAKKMAIEYRKELNKRFNCNNGKFGINKPVYAKLIFIDDPIYIHPSKIVKKMVKDLVKVDSNALKC